MKYACSRLRARSVDWHVASTGMAFTATSLRTGCSLVGSTVQDDTHPDVAYDLTNDVYLVVWQRDDALKVPTSALFREGEAWAVFREVEGRGDD